MSIAHDSADDRLSFGRDDRLAKALRLANISSNEMADHLEMSRTTISNYINGRTNPKRSIMRDWAIRTGVPLTWLETGQLPSGPTTGGEQSRLGESNSGPSHYNVVALFGEPALEKVAA